MLEQDRTGVQPVSGSHNRFDRMEWAGAFGYLGTLIPFVVACIGMVGMEPFGILLRPGYGR